MRIRRLVFACLSTLTVCECAIGNGARELAELGSHSAGGGSRAAAEGLGFHGQPAHPAPSHLGDPSNRMPDDIYDYVARAQPQRSDKEMMDQWASEARFELPRLPHPEEWKIKTWWVEHWRPIGRKLRAKLETVFKGLLWPFELLLRSKIEKGVHPMPLKRLPREPTGVWEKFKQESWITRLKNRMKLGRTEQKTEMSVQNQEELIKKSSRTYPRGTKLSKQS